MKENYIWSYLTVTLIIEKHIAFKNGGTRALIFNANNIGLASSVLRLMILAKGVI